MDKDNPTQVGRALEQPLIPAYRRPVLRAYVRDLAGAPARSCASASRIWRRTLKNVFLPDNARFAIVPDEGGTAFVPFAGDLRDILCVHEDRVVGNDNTVRYRNRVLQIPQDRHRHHYVKARVRVHEYPDGGLAIFHGPRCLAKYDANGKPTGEHNTIAA